MGLAGRRKAKQTALKLVKWSTLLLIIAYFLANWFLIRAVDRYIENHTQPLDIEYSWAWFDLSGEFAIHKIQGYYLEDTPLFEIDSLTLEFNSLSSLFSLPEHVAYMSVPSSVTINANQLLLSAEFNLGWINEKLPVPISANLFPQACKDRLNNLPFPLTSQVKLQWSQPTTSEYLFSINVDSMSLMDIVISGQFIEVDNGNISSGFLDSVAINAENLTWFQQALSDCAHQQNIEYEQLVDQFMRQLTQLAANNHYQLSDNLTQQYRQFIALPEKFSLAFSPDKDKSWTQINKLPLYEITQSAAISLALNQAPIDQLIASVDYVGFAKEQQSQQSSNQPTRTSSFLPVSYQGLRKFQGTSVVVHFKRKGAVRGVIEKVSPQQLFLSQYRYGGKSILPYRYNEISFIEISGSR